jgi:MFS family permease
MNINNTQFSILMSSVTLVNTVLPFFAGAFADDLSSSIGTVRGTLAINLVIFIGSLMVTMGAFANNYSIMLAGQVIYGLGDGIIVTFQEAILSRWFRNKQLAIVVGSMLSIARLTKFIAKLICYPLVDLAGTFTQPITIAMILCGLSVLANLIYWAAMVKGGLATLSGREINRPGTINTVEYDVDGKKVESDQRFKFKYSLLLYLQGIFWMVPWLQITMSSVLSSFDDIATEYTQFRYSTTSIMAGYQSSLTQVVPIVAAPLLGIYVHRYGKHLYILGAGTVILIISIILLVYTWAPPTAGMILISFALSFGPVALLTTTSLLLPSELVGVGVGLHKCANNIGTTIVSVIVGYVQDLTFHDGNSSDDQVDLQHEYDYVMILYLLVSCISLLLAFLFWLWDRQHLGSWLQINRKEREKRMEQAKSISAHQYIYKNEQESYYKQQTALKLIGSQLKTKRSFVHIGLFLFWLLIAWVIFFTFALMPIYQSYSLRSL